MSDKAKRAARAAQAVQTRSGFIPPEAEFIRTETKLEVDLERGEILNVSTETDRRKLDALIAILEPLNLEEQSKDRLLNLVQNAAIELFMATPVKLDEQKQKLSKFAKAMKTAAHAWSELGPGLQRSLVEASNDPRSADHLVQSLECRSRLNQVLGDDVHAAAYGAIAIKSVLDSNGAHSPTEYLFVLRVCGAWRDCTGRAPARTGHTDETTGKRSETPFERFIKTAISPRTIGERIIRDALEEFNGAVVDKS